MNTANTHISPSVSIIIPVYNSECYLRRCVNSLLCQDYEDFEIILIDDGSTDGSGKICDDLSLCDNRVYVIHQNNRGVGASRNAGIRMAKADWLLFVDSDDYCEKGYIKSFFSHELNPKVLFIQGLKNVSENGANLGNIEFNDMICEGEQMLKSIKDYFLLNFGAPYCKLYSKRMIIENGISFPETYSYGEDSLFFFNYLRTIRGIRFLHQEKYCYVRFEGNSLSTKIHKPETILSFVSDSLKTLKCLDPDKRSILPYVMYLLKLVYHSLLNMYVLHYNGKERSEIIRDTKEDVIPLFHELGTGSLYGDFLWQSLELVPVPILDVEFFVIKKVRNFLNLSMHK